MGNLNVKSVIDSFALLKGINTQVEDSSRYHSHGLFPYPAMMVPRLQGALIKSLLEKSKSSEKSVFDPFMGSGTVLSETLSNGGDFYGSDINPLSILCGQVKSDYFSLSLARKNMDSLALYLKGRRLSLNFLKFFGDEKWFDTESLSALTAVHEAVCAIEHKWCRRIFWLALCETVRKVSKTRLSTYKLHINKDHRSVSGSKVVDLFLGLCKRNIELKRQFWEELKVNGFVYRNKLLSKVHLELSDARCLNSSFKADLVVTSPPYGDNHTTVTYGQFSYLPLQFVDLDDIGHTFDRSLVESASGIDSASLGGSLRGWNEKLEEIEGQSESLRRSVNDLKCKGRGGEKRLVSFCYDLHNSLITISQRLKPRGYAMFTLGNRKINGVPMPLDKIVEQFLSGLGFDLVSVVDRKIMKKRMAGSMDAEKILIMRK